MGHILDVFHGIISAIILNCFLGVLFVLSLWHNYVTVHVKKLFDPRDTRSSHTNIKPPNNKRYPTRRYQKGRNPSFSSISSETPLDLEDDEENHIEYDHTITTAASNPHTSSHPITSQVKYSQQENPFADILTNEDRKLVPDLKYYYRQYGIDIEEFEVETDDGFIIDLWHLKSLKTEGKNKKDTYPILMLHGLLQSSGAFASCGRKSLAYFLHDSGYDVWLGNNRCGLKAKWNMEKLAWQ